MTIKFDPEDVPSDELRDKILDQIKSVREYGKPNSRQRDILDSLEEWATEHRSLTSGRRELLASLRLELLGEDD